MKVDKGQQHREYKAYEDARAKRQLELWKEREAMQIRRPLYPGSTYIAAMGNHWRQGCFEAVHAMYRYTQDYGYQVRLEEQHDRCYRPYDSLGTMRNYAYMQARIQGYEYILYLDNDIQPPKDALVRMLSRHVPIVAPLVRYADGQSHGLGTPTVEQGQGLAMVSNVVLSMLLMETAVFTPWADGGFWSDSIGADEGFHFLKLDSYAHRPFLDTDVVVQCMDPPHFPLDATINRKTEDLDAFRNGGLVDG